MALDIRRPAPDAPGPAGPDLAEKGRDAQGATTRLDRRLYIQLLSYTGCPSTDAVAEQMDASGLPGVVYASAHDPRGVAVATFSEDAGFFVAEGRALHTSGALAALTPLPHLTMFGRTYSIGYEADLADTLVARPVRTMTNPAWPWAVWYPLRRRGAFERLSADEQRTMLMEHGGIGRSFGAADLAHDVRLNCQGLDPGDNDFVAGLVGKDLHPLSAVVARMRGTRQTAEFIERLGPFVVGRAVWQRAEPA